MVERPVLHLWEGVYCTVDKKPRATIAVMGIMASSVELERETSMHKDGYHRKSHKQHSERRKKKVTVEADPTAEDVEASPESAGRAKSSKWCLGGVPGIFVVCERLSLAVASQG
jgi:hypothetical protein